MRILYASLAVCLAACSSGKRSEVQPRPELIETARALAESACACETDKECLKTVRADWDAQRDDMMKHGLAGEQQQAFDAAILRMRQCGDAGGLTFWMPNPAP